MVKLGLDEKSHGNRTPHVDRNKNDLKQRWIITKMHGNPLGIAGNKPEQVQEEKANEETYGKSLEGPHLGLV